MIRLNPLRLDYQDHFQKLIDDYNAGSINLEFFFAELMKFAQMSQRGGEANRQ